MCELPRKFRRCVNLIRSRSKTSPEIIRLAVMMYVRFPRSRRRAENVEFKANPIRSGGGIWTRFSFGLMANCKLYRRFKSIFPLQHRGRPYMTKPRAAMICRHAYFPLAEPSKERVERSRSNLSAASRDTFPKPAKKFSALRWERAIPTPAAEYGQLDPTEES